MLYWLNLIFNSNQGLVLFRQTQIFRSTRHKSYRKKAMRIFYTAPCLQFTIDKFTTPKHIEEVLEQPIFLNPHTKLNFSSNNPYFYSILTKNIKDMFTIIRDLCQFLQSGLIFYTRCEEKLDHSAQWLNVHN